jgi:hypothetical protein
LQMASFPMNVTKRKRSFWGVLRLSSRYWWDDYLARMDWEKMLLSKQFMFLYNAAHSLHYKKQQSS